MPVVKVKISEKLIDDGYTFISSTCKDCGNTITPENCIQIMKRDDKKKTFKPFNRCLFCNKEYNQKYYSHKTKKCAGITEIDKDALRMIRKAIGVKDWKEDSGKPCLEGLEI